MLARKLAVLATGVAAGLAFATPAQAAGASVDFGQKELGQSESKAITVQLTTTAGDIRSAFKSAINGHDFGDITIGTETVTDAQLKDVLAAAVGDLDGSTKFSFKIFDLTLAGHNDFTVDNGCDGKDGQDTATCEVTAVFTPAVEGARNANANAAIGWTGGQGDLTKAFAAAALTELPEPLNELVSEEAEAVIELIDGDLADLLEEIYNPIAELKGVGIAPGSGGGGGQTPPPGNGGGGNGGGGSQLPKTGVKVAELAAGGAALLVLGFGIVFLARRRQNA